MKKIFLVIAVFALTITSHAQISGGLKAGLNLSTFGGSEDANIKPGFHFGGYMNIGLNEKLTFQPELLISTTGAKIESKGAGISLESTNKLLYLSIPLGLQYSFGNFNVHLGPQLSFLMSAKTEYSLTGRDISNNPYTVSDEADTKKYFRDCDLSMNFGAGYNFGKLGVRARYTLGLIDISDPELVGNDRETGSYKANNVIQISAMYKLYGK